MKIAENTLYKLLTHMVDNKGNWKDPIHDGYKLIEDDIISSDAEDGGADHRAVIHHIESNKYYVVNYTDWDIFNTEYDNKSDKIGSRCDLNTTLREVFPRTKMITVYESFKN